MYTYILYFKIYVIIILVIPCKGSTSRTVIVKPIKIDISEVEKSALYHSKT